MNAVELNNVSKHYSDFSLSNLNLNIKTGTVLGLVGENGAGKTTLIKMLLNLIRTETGTIKLFGLDIYENEYEIKSKLGVVLDGCFFPENLTIKSIESILKNLYRSWNSKQFTEYCKKFNLPNNKAIKDFSKGMRMKLMIICALCHDVKLLILDEPTSGLDPIVRTEILELFRDFMLDETHTILISSHITSDLEHIADEIAFIHQGKIVLHESYDTLSNDYGIVRCDQKQLEALNKEYIISSIKNAYSIDVLVKNVSLIKKHFPDLLIDRGSIEEMMILIVKGEK